MNEKREVFVTTIDNPYNYFDEFDKWFSYDESQGYHTCSFVDNLSLNMFSDSTDKEIEEEIERAVDIIVKFEGDQKYKKIVRIGDKDIDENDERFQNPIDYDD